MTARIVHVETGDRLTVTEHLRNWTPIAIPGGVAAIAWWQQHGWRPDPTPQEGDDV